MTIVAADMLTYHIYIYILFRSTKGRSHHYHVDAYITLFFSTTFMRLVAEVLVISYFI